MMRVMMSGKCPGWTWVRRARFYECAWHPPLWIWVRSPWRVLAVWAATVAVWTLIVYGVCR